MLRWLLASFHLLAFGLGLGAIVGRAVALRSLSEAQALRRALRADNWWAAAAALWLGTGVPRLLMGTEKAREYYLSNWMFWLKMALFALIFLLEVRPILILMTWRRSIARGESPDTSRAAGMARTSEVQVALLLLTLFAATAMARGFGVRPGSP